MRAFNCIDSNCRSGSCWIHFCQCTDERTSLNQRAKGRRNAHTLDQIALPIVRHDAVFDLWTAQRDTHHFRYGTVPTCIPSARSPTLADLAQAGDQLSAQLTGRHGVKRGQVDLVADLELRIARLHSAQHNRDLFRRMSTAQQSCDVAP